MEASHSTIRNDIQGLRAVAILVVVIFHAFPVRLPSGYVGVDIFFVISGYLISKGILNGLQKANFSLLDFYVRRAARLFPALVTVLAATLTMGWYLLLPSEFSQLGKHTGATTIFSQNFVLWSESGYFDNAADSKPLLHMWSLAIEEQFYIFWPLLLLWFWRRHASLLRLTTFIAAASFALNLYLVKSDITAAFYSPLSRFWELMIGAFLAIIMREQPAVGLTHSNFQSIVGSLLILAALILLDGTSLFPGAWALLPTLGTALMISAGESAWINRTLISNRFFVWIGLISYPLYLWHWPLLSLLRIVHGEQAPASHRLAAVALAILLAWLTVRIVENPLRPWLTSTQRSPLAFGAMGTIALAGLAAGLHQFPPRHETPGLEVVASALGDREYPRYLSKLTLAPKGVYFANSQNSDTTLFIGDSHIEHYSPRIVQTIAESKGSARGAIFAAEGGCPPIPGLQLVNMNCDMVREYGFNKVNDPNVKAIVVGACWNCYFIKQHDDAYIAIREGKRLSLQWPEGTELALLNLEDKLAEIAKSGKTTYLLLDNHSGPEFNPRSMIVGSRFGKLAGLSSQRTLPIDPRQVRLRERLISMAHRLNILILDPMSITCRETECTKIDEDGNPIFSDDNHLRPQFIRTHANFIDETLFDRGARQAVGE